MDRTPAFAIEAVADGEASEFTVRFEGETLVHRLPGGETIHYERFFDAVAERFGTRRPRQLDEPAAPADSRGWAPLITTNLHPKILSGYGDPAVMKVDDGWLLVATSNDAPDAFPLLRSSDLTVWESAGFVFPQGQAPEWTAAGVGVGDFWAPEIARVGAEYWLTYTARAADRTLAIGLARASDPLGPFEDLGRPLLTGSVIDAHIHVDDEGAPWLLWKRDTNSHWPRPLAGLLRERPELIELLFSSKADRRTAALCAALQPWANTRRPMERFFLMQPLIGAALANWDAVRAELRKTDGAEEIVENMVTPLLAQRLAADGASVIGEPVQLLANDLAWEGHLIEGPFLARAEGRYWLFYAGNDFTSPMYGIGVAVADRLTGPYVKQGEPLLRSTGQWLAPGHASVSVGLDGRPQLFFHAFHPDTGGYNEFRALLTVGLDFTPERVAIRDL